MSIARRSDFCCCMAWNWFSAPTRLSCREYDGFPCSAMYSVRGIDKNSSISTYSRFHTFSTSLVGSVGSPFATRYLARFDSAFFCWVPLEDKVVSQEMRDLKGFFYLLVAAAARHRCIPTPACARPQTMAYCPILCPPAHGIVRGGLRPGRPLLPPSRSYPLSARVLSPVPPYARGVYARSPLCPPLPPPFHCANDSPFSPSLLPRDGPLPTPLGG